MEQLEYMIVFFLFCFLLLLSYGIYDSCIEKKVRQKYNNILNNKTNNLYIKKTPMGVKIYFIFKDKSKHLITQEDYKQFKKYNLI